ncbi:MAG TPA: YdeI/OmpD-associated family protein [Pseudonocardia sp.]|nr:YdeI/OmpD-associated family protein [Pseudonocardia sp.]
MDVDIELDTVTREVTVPAELAAALQREPGAGQAFDTLSTGRRRARPPIETAKAGATGLRRIAKVLDALRGHEAPWPLGDSGRRTLDESRVADGRRWSTQHGSGRNHDQTRTMLS